MKYILTLCFLIGVAYAQEPAYTPMRLNYQFRGIKVDSLFLIPSFTDTTAANSSTMKNVAGAMIRTGNDFWMRNSTTNAWLQNVNVGTGASPSIQFVDSVWRVVGKDSIFWRKGGVTSKIKDSTAGRVVDTIYRTSGKDSIFFKIAGTTYKIKDSSGSVYAGDKPDRINGTATADVTADMGGNIMRFTDASQWKIDNTNQIFIESTDSVIIKQGSIRHLTKNNKYEFKDFNNTFLQIDTLGNFIAGDITKDSLTFSLLRAGNEIVLKSKTTPVWKEQNNGFSMYLKVTRGVNGIDLSSGIYTARVPGVYVIADASVNGFDLPSASDWPGQTLTIINNDSGNTGTLSTSGGSMYDRGTGNNITSIAANEMIIFVSDGTDWYGAIQ